MAMIDDGKTDRLAVIPDYKDFDRSTGPLVERVVFNNRFLFTLFCILITLVAGFFATKLAFNASFEKMLPHDSQYIQNYLTLKSELRGSGNVIRIVVEATQGDIFNPEYLETLKQITDEVLMVPGADRGWMKSIWMPIVRWTSITEEGFKGGPVMPDGYDGSDKSIQQLKANIGRAGIVGTLVGDNFKSSMIVVPLYDIDPDTGKKLNYHAFSKNLEKIRNKYEAAGGGKIKIHVIGFAQVVGDLIDGMGRVATFFLFSVLIAAAIIFWYTRCVRGTLFLLFCSAVAVVWLLGFIYAIGYDIDPYTILVPFLVFAIAVSHGMQRVNCILHDVGRGSDKIVAARYTFRELFLPGLTAVVTDAIGFAVMMLINIPVTRDLAMISSVGMGFVFISSFILLPVTLSYTGVSRSAAKRAVRIEEGKNGGTAAGAWEFLNNFTERRWAVGIVSVAAVLAVVGVFIGSGIQVGDLDPGAPELRPDSRYNMDNAYITTNYGTSSDVFTVIMKTAPDMIWHYEPL
ncbi:MAG: hypothetical protein PHY29_08455, partial [Syntrophales bacterium]|nr:hypothetical protein [Syntrophales bacterium]